MSCASISILPRWRAKTSRSGARGSRTRTSAGHSIVPRRHVAYSPLRRQSKSSQARLGAVNMVDLAPPLLEKYIAQGRHGASEEFRLSSHFQAIFSLAHRRPVGYEGLIRASDPEGRRVAPFELFSTAPHGEARVGLDRQCRALHVRNFQKLGNARSWLFLNVDPQVASEGPRLGSFFAEMLESNDFPAHRVAVELIETPFEDEGRLTSAVEYYRKLGCLIVIDDFGAGYSNFDRIWS